jgi:hypothetical protein
MTDDKSCTTCFYGAEDPDRFPCSSCSAIDSRSDVLRWRPTTSTESFFPIVIEICEGNDKGINKVVYKPTDIPSGIPFKVLATKVLV